MEQSDGRRPEAEKKEAEEQREKTKGKEKGWESRDRRVKIEG